MIFPCSSVDFGSFHDILDLADVADVFVADSIPQSVAVHLEILISVDLSKRLMKRAAITFDRIAHFVRYSSKQLLSNRSCPQDLRWRLEHRFLAEEYRTESAAERSRGIRIVANDRSFDPKNTQLLPNRAGRSADTKSAIVSL